ncbi:MAG: glycosyltransferase family 39 protein [bacterium]|nr:glycosyltransferase family 39 protein [bacterium]
MQKALFFIILFAALVRIAGIFYGLPLWLVDDEPPFILAAFKMLELKTLIPAFHAQEFATVLYYPPYLSYLFLPFFLIIAGIMFMFRPEDSAFGTYLLSDLSPFFAGARLLMVIASVASIYLLYRSAKEIFKNRLAGVLAAFFAATSLLYIALSIVGRHWLSVFFVTTLVLFCLSHSAWSVKKRYTLAALAAGLGVGFAIINAISALLIALWALLYEGHRVREVLRDIFWYKIAGFFFILAALPVLLYPKGLGFAADATGATAKSLWGMSASPFSFASVLAASEWVLLLFAATGLFLAWRFARNFFILSAAYLYSYSIVFYLIFRFEPRFFLGLLPFYFLLAGYGAALLLQRTPQSLLHVGLGVLLFLPILFSARLGVLAARSDSRIFALQFAQQHIPAGSKIFVLARLTYAPTTHMAINEQTELDPDSVRSVQRAQAQVREKTGEVAFHALNLSDLNNEEFFENVTAYARENNYEYLLIQPTLPAAKYFAQLVSNAELLASFEGAPTQTRECIACGSAPTTLSIAESQFIGNPFRLFSTKELGPPIGIYRLQF